MKSIYLALFYCVLVSPLYGQLPDAVKRAHILWNKGAKEKAAEIYIDHYQELEGFSRTVVLSRIKEVYRSKVFGKFDPMPIKDAVDILTLRGWEIEDETASTTVGAHVTTWSSKPFRANEFLFEYKVKSKWYQMILVHLDGRCVSVSVGHWWNTGVNVFNHQTKTAVLEMRPGKTVPDREWHTVSVSLIEGVLTYLYDDEIIWRVDVPRRPYLVSVGIGSYDTDISVKDFRLDSH